MLSSVGLLLLLSAPADTATNRHDGFFLRLQQGAGASGIRREPHGDPDSASLEWSVSMGGALREHLVMHGDLFLEAEHGGGRKMLGIGAGLTFYSETNLYLTAGLGMAEVYDGAGRDGGGHYGGPALRAQFGQEWWSSANWGLGLAIGGRAVFAPDGWGYRSLTLVFSASYN